MVNYSFAISGSFISGCTELFISGLFSFFAFFHFANNTTQAIATTKQHIQIKGLATSQAIQIVKNHTTKVSHNAIMLVHTQIMFDNKGITFANVSINLNIAANQQNINNSQINLMIHVN